jgi:CCR4-NOT transcription complex subunit 1
VISKLILEAGYECCSTVQSVRELLSKSSVPLDEQQVAETLGCMARTYTNMTGVGNGSMQPDTSWNVENFVTVVKDQVS